MDVTKLSSKGQVIIPKHLRTVHRWESGQELMVVNIRDGVLLKPKKPFRKTTIADVASCLEYTGEAKTLDDMEQAISQGIKERFHDCG
uniref:Transcriptional regulator, AbrB family n=1 Tax=Candidatus Kentrum sp. FW TaxID=2126338 RepID=A0A450TBQ2_9GAMM|nr:MAG: transcriptional regulator, AbrB family [Candidatus Kentron sp. FW]